MGPLAPWARVALWLANVAALAFLLLPLAPVVLGALQSEKALTGDVRGPPRRSRNGCSARRTDTL